MKFQYGDQVRIVKGFSLGNGETTTGMVGEIVNPEKSDDPVSAEPGWVAVQFSGKSIPLFHLEGNVERVADSQS